MMEGREDESDADEIFLGMVARSLVSHVDHVVTMMDHSASNLNTLTYTLIRSKHIDRYL